jgi:hypothetical protein
MARKPVAQTDVSSGLSIETDIRVAAWQDAHPEIGSLHA